MQSIREFRSKHTRQPLSIISTDETPEDIQLECTPMATTVDVKTLPASKVVHEHLLEYIQSSSLHGLKYLGETHRPRSERLLWLVALILSVCSCAYLVLSVWDKWETSPVILTPEPTPRNAWDVPFPAVTVCSSIKSRQTFFNFTDARFRDTYPSNLTNKEKQMFHDICLLCSTEECGMFSEYSASETSVRFLKRTAPPVEEVVWFASWMHNDVPPRSTFTPHLTEEGVCYTFNILDVEELYTKEVLQRDHSYMNSTRLRRSEWSAETGYSRSASVASYPERALVGSRDANGLSLHLIAYHEDMDYLCTRSEQGFKIFLHSPTEPPQARYHPVIQVDLKQAVRVTVEPTMTTTSDRVKNYAPQQRQCFYPSEKRLSFFRVYTKANCKLECFINYTLSACGCVPFYFPRSKTMPICRVWTRQLCFKDFPLAIQLWELWREPRYNVKGNQHTSLDNWVNTKIGDMLSKNTTQSDCNCLPSCTSLRYEVAMSKSSSFKVEEYLSAQPELKHFMARTKGSKASFSVSKVVISMNDIHFVANQRTELFGQTDFLANCGGLLGLFMGFSVLSLVELVYFCTISLCTRLHKKRSSPNEVTAK